MDNSVDEVEVEYGSVSFSPDVKYVYFQIPSFKSQGIISASSWAIECSTSVDTQEVAEKGLNDRGDQ